MIGPDSVIRKNKKIVFRDIGGILYVFDDKKMVMHTYNEVGSFIWRMLKAPKRVAYIVGKIAQAYEVSLKKAEVDVITFVEAEAGRLFLLDNS